VIGQNPDGTYWDANFRPKTKSGFGINCCGKIDFNEKSGFDPNKLTDGVEMKDHLKTSPKVDASARAEAKRRADAENQPRYDALGYNCRDFASGIMNFARGAQLKDNTGGN